MAVDDIKGYFTADHRRCDDLWSAVEAAADGGSVDPARAAWSAFSHAMLRHLSMEEEVLFPAFEEATGMRGGPTAVMRMEHTQMRQVLGQIGLAADQGDLQGMLDHGDTLMMLIQQHNVKEEGMLYPMASQALAGQAAEILARLSAYPA